jgi:hypothetical protein
LPKIVVLKKSKGKFVGQKNSRMTLKGKKGRGRRSLERSQEEKGEEVRKEGMGEEIRKGGNIKRSLKEREGKVKFGKERKETWKGQKKGKGRREGKVRKGQKKGKGGGKGKFEKK